MGRIILGKEFKQLEQLAYQYDNLTTSDLIMRSAQGIFYHFKRKFKVNTIHPIVFAGPGKTGAVALALSLLLSQEGYRTSVYLIYKKRQISKESESFRNDIIDSEIIFKEIYEEFVPPIFDPKKDVIVDGLFGVGLIGPLSGGFAAVVKLINQSKCKVFSIDMPSGMQAEDNSNIPKDVIIRATYTITIEEPKLSFFMVENTAYVGEWKVLSIGISDETKIRIKSSYLSSSQLSISSTLRSLQGRERGYGRLLIVGAHNQNVGQMLLAAKASLKAGAIDVCCHLPSGCVLPMQVYSPEVDIITDKSETHLTTLKEASNFRVVAFVSDLGNGEESFAAIKDFCTNNPNPIVLSGNAIRSFLKRKELLSVLPEASVIVLSNDDLDGLNIGGRTDYERIEMAKVLSSKWKIYVVLKLHYTCVCMPSGTVVFNDISNQTVLHSRASIAVLSSTIAAFMAQNISPVSSSVLGGYVTTMSADIASGAKKNKNITTSDLVSQINETLAILNT